MAGGLGAPTEAPAAAASAQVTASTGMPSAWRSARRARSGSPGRRTFGSGSPASSARVQSVEAAISAWKCGAEAIGGDQDRLVPGEVGAHEVIGDERGLARARAGDGEEGGDVVAEIRLGDAYELGHVVPLPL